MLFWKKVEIYSGNSLKEFSELRDALASKKIRYDYKLLKNNPNLDTKYNLYIHHQDYDWAMYLTSNRRKMD